MNGSNHIIPHEIEPNDNDSIALCFFGTIPTQIPCDSIAMKGIEALSQKHEIIFHLWCR